MRKTQLIIKKFLIFMLVILPLTMSFITPIKSVAIEATPIDLRMYDETSVNAPVHTHIWSTKFDDNYHWEECSVCRNTRNKTAHVLVGNGGSKCLCDNGYYNQAYRETCSCGFQSKPQVLVHGRFENYENCQTLNYGTMNGQTFDNLMHVSYAEFQDLLNGTNNSGKNPDNQQLPANAGGQAYTWHAVDDKGLGLIFMGGPVISDTKGIKGTLELIIGSEGDCGKGVAFHEYFTLARYIYMTENPTRAGFIQYMENDTPNAAYINNTDHMLYGYPTKYRNRVTDAQWNQIVSAFKGYYTHTSNWGWSTMNIQHAGHADSGNYIYANNTCYDSENHHAFSTMDGIKTRCDICGCNYTGNESYVAKTWYRCAQHQKMADGETKTCTGHVLTGKNNVKLGTMYCNYARNNGVTLRTSVTVVPESGFSVIQDTTTQNVEVPKSDTTNPSSQWAYYGVVTLSNGQSGDALIQRSVDCGIDYAYIDTVAPVAYGYSNNQTINANWKVEGRGTQTNPTTQSTITVTFKDPQEYSRNVVRVKVYDSDQRTVLPQGNNVTETPLTKVAGTSGADTLWRGTINVKTEVNGTKNVYIQAIDSSNRASALIPMQISYIDAQGPTLNVTANKDNNTWATSKMITVAGSDDYTYFSIGTSANEMVQVGNTTYNNQRQYEVVGDTYSTPRTIRFYAQDAAGNLSYKDYSIARIDNTKPTITDTIVTVGNHSSTVTVTANDINTTLNESGSGVSTYAISTTASVPANSNFQTGNSFTITNPGQYYIFAKDAVGNVSIATAIMVPIKYNLTINPNGGKYNNSSTNTITEVQNGITKDITIPSRVGYNFIGWTLNGNGSTLTYSGNSLTQPAVFKMGTEDASLTANWQARNDTEYQVRHWKQRIYDNADENIKEYCNTHYDEVCYELEEIDSLQGTSDSSVTPAVKTYEGFTSPERVEVVINADGSRVLDYFYTRNEYNVELSGDNGIENLKGARKYLYDDTVEIEATVKPGYEWKKWEGNQVSGTEQTYTFNMPANNIEENASTTIITYTLTYDSNDADPTTSKAIMPENPEEYNVETEEFTITNPTRDGFEFVGWTVENDETDFEELQENEEDENEVQSNEKKIFAIEEPTTELTIPKGTYGHLLLTANWKEKADTQYKVQHWRQRIYKNDVADNGITNASIYNEENYELVDTDELEGITDRIVEPDAKEYEGFTSPAKRELLISGDGTAVMNYYYTRNYYKLTVDKDEYVESTEGTGIYLYGENVKVNCKTAKGYSFKEWQGDKEDMQQEDYVTMPANDAEIKALSQKNKHQIKIDLGDKELVIDVEYDDVITIDSPEKEGYEFLYFETNDGEKIYDNKLHIEDKDYVIKPVWSKIPTMSLPKTGEQNSDILLILYSIITIMAFGTAIFFASKTKE